jgi:hypothetical protein
MARGGSCWTSDEVALLCTCFVLSPLAAKFRPSTPSRPAHQGALTMKLLGKNVRLLGGLDVMDRGLL